MFLFYLLLSLRTKGEGRTLNGFFLVEKEVNEESYDHAKGSGELNKRRGCYQRTIKSVLTEKISRDAGQEERKGYKFANLISYEGGQADKS